MIPKTRCNKKKKKIKKSWVCLQKLGRNIIPSRIIQLFNTIQMKNIFAIAVITLSVFDSFFVYASCDCGSDDTDMTCRSRGLEVTVKATTINGKLSQDATFSWKFNNAGKDVYCGQFANGDYWIAPQEGKEIQVTSVGANGLLSLDENPQTQKTGLIKVSKPYANFDKSENLMSILPATIVAPSSLVAAVQRNEKQSGKCGTVSIEGRCVDAYHVVTVLESVPDYAGKNIIRPNISGRLKKLITLNDFDFSRLPEKDFISGQSKEGYEKIRQRWSHNIEIFGAYSIRKKKYFSEGGRAFRAHILVDDYGAGWARQWYSDMLVMFSADSIRKKQKALAAMLAFGRDLYCSMYDSPDSKYISWGAGASQHAGRFIPAVFFAALAKDPSYAEKLMTVASKIHDFKDSGPAELSQVHMGKNGLVWGDMMFGKKETQAYWNDLFKAKCYQGAGEPCNPRVGSKTGRDPYGYIDGPATIPGSAYMKSSAGSQRALAASMVLMPEIGRIVNFPQLLEYVERLDKVGISTANDPCAPPDSRESKSCNPWKNGSGCIYYGRTWGPDPLDETKCIKENMGMGRFPSRHGEKMGYGYTVKEVEANWGIIRERITLYLDRKNN